MIDAWANAAVGGTVSAAAMLVLHRATTTGAALALHPLTTAVVFGLIAWSYFRRRGARDPAPTALTFAGITAVLQVLAIATVAELSAPLFDVLAALWLPVLLTAVVTWVTGGLLAVLPLPKPPAASAPHATSSAH